MKKRLFVVLAVLALTVCLLPMVVGAASDVCPKNDGKPHDWQYESVYSPATCTEPGAAQYRCSVCRKVDYVNYPIPATGHTEESIPAVAADCQNTGLTEGKKCSVCDEILVEQTVTQKLPHNHKEFMSVETPAGCETTGLARYRCTNILRDGKQCPNQNANIVIPATGHNNNDGVWSNDSGDAANHNYTCDACGTRQYEAHVFVGTSCTSKGKCVCGKEQEMLPHTPKTDEAVAPKCEATGLTEGSHCSVCQTVLVKQDVIPATGHAWDDGVVTKPATGFATGIKLYTCKNDPSHTYEKATPVLYVPDDPNLDRVPRTGNAFIEWLYALIAG